MTKEIEVDKETDAIVFEAYDVTIRNRRDGGYRLTLDLSETESEAASEFMKLKLYDQRFGVSAVPLKKDE